MIKKEKLLLITSAVLMIGILTHVDRIFFKRGSSFCARFLHSSLSYDPTWDLPEPTPDQHQALKQILSQKFHYLAKGAHCFAFISEDQKYVIKFHRFASHMRIFPWLTHPFSYYFNERRKKIKQHNFQRLSINFSSYKDSDQYLKDETGVLLTHINPSDNLHLTITLVDKTKAQHRIHLDDVTFILQKKANLIYPTLDSLYSQNKLDEAKQVVSHIIQLVTSCCQKGFIDDDPVLRKNYGLLEDCAIHIDVGDLIRNDAMKLRENYIPHVKEMTESLRKRLENHYPLLLEHYNEMIEKL